MSFGRFVVYLVASWAVTRRPRDDSGAMLNNQTLMEFKLSQELRQHTADVSGHASFAHVQRFVLSPLEATKLSFLHQEIQQSDRGNSQELGNRKTSLSAMLGS